MKAVFIYRGNFLPLFKRKIYKSWFYKVQFVSFCGGEGGGGGGNLKPELGNLLDVSCKNSSNFKLLHHSRFLAV